MLCTAENLLTFQLQKLDKLHLYISSSTATAELLTLCNNLIVMVCKRNVISLEFFIVISFCSFDLLAYIHLFEFDLLALTCTCLNGCILVAQRLCIAVYVFVISFCQYLYTRIFLFIWLCYMAAFEQLMN